MKKLILIFLSLALTLALASCGECKHVDENNDGICDECEWNYDHEHTYGESWAYDNENHWHGADCGHNVEKDKALHIDENNDGVCEVCDFGSDHVHTYEDGWTYDSAEHWHKVDCGHSADVKDKAAHRDADNNSKCDVCDWNYGHEHTYEAEWSYDNAEHWHAVTCPHDVEVSGKAQHTDANEDGICDVCRYGEVKLPSGDIELPEIEF